MDQFSAWAGAHPGLIVGAVWLAMIALWLGAFVHRVAAGKAVMPRPPENSLFVERRVTGRGLGNILSALSYYDKALLVSVTRDKITVQFSFPFSIMPFPKGNIEHEIGRSRLRKVEVRDGLFGKKKVTVSFSTPSRGDVEIELHLQNHELFLKAVDEMRGAGARR